MDAKRWSEKQDRGLRPESVAHVVAGWVRELRGMGDPVRARGMAAYFRNRIVSLGIDTPTLRRFVRERTVERRGAWGPAEATELCDRLVHEPEFEIRAVGILILGRWVRHLTPEVLTTGERWLATRFDNWAHVDSFCGSVVTPLLERYPAIGSTLEVWSGRPILWVRRAAVVSLVAPARRGRHLDLAYRLAGEHLADEEDLMHKAVGWLLREAGKTDAARLKTFLLSRGPEIPRTAVRYAIERFGDRERGELLRATRGS